MDSKKLKLPKNVSVTYTSASKRGRPKKDRTVEPETTTPICVKIDRMNWEKFQKIAKFKGETASGIINEMILDYIKKNEKGLLQVEAAIKSAFKK